MNVMDSVFVVRKMPIYLGSLSVFKVFFLLINIFFCGHENIYQFGFFVSFSGAAVWINWVFQVLFLTV